MLDVDGRARQPPARQHGVLRLHARTGAVLPFGSLVATLSESQAKPIPCDDNLPVGTGVGRRGSRAPIVRDMPTDSWQRRVGGGAMLRSPVLAVREVDEGTQSGRAATGGSPPIVCVLPISSGADQDPRRTRIRRRDVRHRSGRPEAPVANRRAMEHHGAPVALNRPWEMLIDQPRPRGESQS